MAAARHQGKTARGKLRGHRGLAKRVLRVHRLRRCGIAHRGAEALACRVGSGRRAEHVLHWPGQFAVPVVVEGRRQLSHHRTRGQHVQIDEVVVRVAHEVFVADVAPTEDRQRVVGDQELVVHAMVVQLEVARRQQQTSRWRPLAQCQRIEQSDLHVVVRAKVEQQILERRSVVVVQQQPHAHTARCRVAKRAQQRTAGMVWLPVVILQVNRTLGKLHQRHARVECELASGQQAKTRRHVTRRDAHRQAGHSDAGQQRALGVGIRRGRFAGAALSERSASDQQGRQKTSKQQPCRASRHVGVRSGRQQHRRQARSGS